MVHRCYLCLCLLLTLVGCQGPQVSAHIESVNAEYRQLEDYVYSLEEENARLCQELEFERQRAAGTKSSESRGAPIRRRGTPAPPDSSPEPPTIELPGTSPSTAPSGAAPTIELPPPANSPARGTGGITPAAAEEPTARPSAPRRPADMKVTQLSLGPDLTGGADMDGQAGDDGLVVVFTPLNSGQQYVPKAGAVSIVVLDPSRQGDAARIARWDFDRAAVEQFLQNSSDERGIKVELPWPAAPPSSTKLHVFARYETADGRKLQADREITVAPLGQTTTRSAGWTPRPLERQRLAAPIQDQSPIPTVAATGSPGNAAPPATLPMPSTNAAEADASSPSTVTTAPAALSDDVPASRVSRPVWSPFR